MWYLKLFEKGTDYETFKGGGDWLTPNVSYAIDTMNVYYTSNNVEEWYSNYMTIEALEDGLTATFNMTEGNESVEYCIDNGDWISISSGEETPSINQGQMIAFKGTLTPMNNNDVYGIGTFSISKECNLKGNCMSLLFGDDAKNEFSLSDKAMAFMRLFADCSTIISAKDLYLPATTLAFGCYIEMFMNCTSLITAPTILPATTLADLCYTNMFAGCISLVTAPELPATTLANACYEEMFLGCTSLVTAPELPATTLAEYCYSSMFVACTSLVTTPELPATTLAEGCYNYMFQNCTSLVTAPELPATTLASDCYQCMFDNCSSLTESPILPAEILAPFCYFHMFWGCVSLNKITMLAKDISANECMTMWTGMLDDNDNEVSAVSPIGTFIKHPDMTSLPIGTQENRYSGIPEGWVVQNFGTSEPELEPKKYLTIEALEDGLTAKLSLNACEYCVDEDGNWKTLSADTPTESINAGQTLSFRGNLEPNPGNGIGRFEISKKCNVLGNVMSMLFGDDAQNNFSLSGKDLAFMWLFSYCSNIISAKDLYLPATELAVGCYSGMFAACTSLTSAPELPATTLAEGCYSGMFGGCTSLTAAPELPATTLAEACYTYMFEGCTSLNHIKMLATDISASNCLSSWVKNVADTGTFIKHPDMTSLPIGTSGIPEGWTVIDHDSDGGDGSGTDINVDNYLTIEALEDGLTATFNFMHINGDEIVEYCIDNGDWMSISSGEETPSINQGQMISFRSNLKGTFDYNFGRPNGIGKFEINKKCKLKGNCTSLLYGDEAKLHSSLEDNIGPFYELFYGCSNIIEVEETFLPSTEVSWFAYSRMFYDCTSLVTAPELPATILGTYCYDSMFQNCTSLVTAPELPATTLTNACYGGMFYGCTSLTTAPELPATTLVNNCYSSMFRGCTKLNHIKMLATDIPASNCLYNWVSNVSSSGTFIKHPDMTSLPIGESGIPEGWEVNDYVQYNEFTLSHASWGQNDNGEWIAVDDLDTMTTFTFESGMTWREWINSEYNTDASMGDDSFGLMIRYNTIEAKGKDDEYNRECRDIDRNIVYADDVIEQKHYRLWKPDPM